VGGGEMSGGKKKKAEVETDQAAAYKAYRETLLQIFNEKLKALPGRGKGDGLDPYLSIFPQVIERLTAGTILTGEALERFNAETLDSYLIRKCGGKFPSLLKLAKLEADHYVRSSLDPKWPDNTEEFNRKVDEALKRKQEKDEAWRIAKEPARLHAKKERQKHLKEMNEHVKKGKNTPERDVHGDEPGAQGEGGVMGMDLTTFYKFNLDPHEPFKIDKLHDEWQDLYKVVSGGDLCFAISSDPTPEEWQTAKQKITALLTVMERWSHYYENPKLADVFTCAKGSLENTTGPVYFGDQGWKEWTKILLKALIGANEAEEKLCLIVQDFMYQDFIREQSKGNADGRTEDSEHTQSENIFKEDGEIFKIVFEGEKLGSIKSIDGMKYIQYLLQHPNKEFTAVQLQNEIKGVPNLDYGEASKMSYAEMQDHGLDKRVDRAKDNIKKAITLAYKKLEENSGSALVTHLKKHISGGTSLMYQPPKDLSWKF
jgi:hypothetical protein